MDADKIAFRRVEGPSRFRIVDGATGREIADLRAVEVRGPMDGATELVLTCLLLREGKDALLQELGLA